MRPRAIWAAGFVLACAAPGAAGIAHTTPTAVWVRSHNRSAVDLYLLCGDRDAQWLGEVPGRSAEAFEVPPGRPYCPWDLNFFLVVRGSGRGYWVGPLRHSGRRAVDLVIERYAGLSSARVRP